MSTTVNKALEKLSERDKKLNLFSELLDTIDSLEDKKKHLWKEVYENALSDRESASFLFTNLLKDMSGASQHALLGTIATKYLERMCKSNDQILRLAELVAKAEESSATFDPEDVFNEIASIGKEK